MIFLENVLLKQKCYKEIVMEKFIYENNDLEIADLQCHLCLNFNIQTGKCKIFGDIPKNVQDSEKMCESFEYEDNESFS